jgi:hypothetical protein
MRLHQRPVEEIFLTGCQDFVHDQNVGIQVRSDGKGQTNVHPATVTFYRSIQKSLSLSKGHDRCEFLIYLETIHAENGSVQVDIPSSRQFRVKARPDFQQTTDTPVKVDASSCRFRDSAKDLQQSCLPRAISTDDSENLTAINLKRHISKRPKLFLLRDQRALGKEVADCFA